jgi:hypothetical protein
MIETISGNPGAVHHTLFSGIAPSGQGQGEQSR